MGKGVEWESKVNDLKRAIMCGDLNEVDKAKIDCVWEASNLLEMIINYITLERNGVHFDFGSYIIPKGTILYRIRRYDSEVDFSDKQQWAPPPHKPENRANREGQVALYLNIMSDMCVLETHIKVGEKYVLGRYECVKDIEVGGYISSFGNKRLFDIGIILNAFLIAPTRSKDNIQLFELLDSYLGNVAVEDLKYDIVKNNLILPFKFAVMNQGQQLYKITNILCDIIREKYPMGIKYSSSFCPLETVNIKSNCYNVVLYEDGISNVRFIDYEIRENKHKDFTSENVVAIILDTINSKNVEGAV